MWNKIKDVVSQYLEINETRKSIIVITLIGFVIIGIYKAYLGNDVPPVIGNIVLGLAGIIFGTNVGNQISTIYGNYTSGKNCNINVEKATDNDINGSI